jgi:hypothetical protein
MACPLNACGCAYCQLHRRLGIVAWVLARGQEGIFRSHVDNSGTSNLRKSSENPMHVLDTIATVTSLLGCYFCTRTIYLIHVVGCAAVLCPASECVPLMISDCQPYLPSAIGMRTCMRTCYTCVAFVETGLVQCCQRVWALHAGSCCVSCRRSEL